MGTGRKSCVWGGNGSSSDQRCLAVTFCSNLMRVRRSCSKNTAWKYNTALNTSHFEGYNFTYSARQVVSKYGARIYCIFIPGGADTFHTLPSLSAYSFMKGRQRGIQPAFRCTNTKNLQVLDFYSPLSLFLPLSYSTLLSGSLMLEVPLTQSALQRDYRRYYFCKRWRSSLCKRKNFPGVMYYSNFSTFYPFFS